MTRIKKQRFILTIALVLSLIIHLCYGLEGEKQMLELQYKLDHQEAIIQDRDEQIEIMDMLLDQKVVPELKPKETYIGEFTITYYCACRECCDKADGITASGTLAQEGQTVAADWDLFEPGTEIFIEGIGFRTVEDKGGAIQSNRLDVYMDSHSAALEAGIGQAKVYIVEGINR